MRPSFHAIAAHFWRRQLEGVEVGVEFGKNALQAFEEWPHGAVRLTLVEKDARREADIRARLKGHEDKFDLIIGDSAEVAERFPKESFDFVYIDDDHQEPGVRNSVGAWKWKVKRGGILAGHDIYMPTVRQVVMDLWDETGWPLYIAEWDWWFLRG